MICPATKAICHETCSGQCSIAIRALAQSKLIIERRKREEEDTDIVPTISVDEYYVEVANT
jgi:hypothetical protein